MTTSAMATRERLLEAAGEVFAEHGYQGATVRRICERAEANVSAVNYHFGDKEQLHREVLRYAFDSTHARHPVANPEPDQPLAEALRAFVNGFLSRLFSIQRSWRGRVMARELADPSEALGDIVEAHMRPTLDALDAIVARACPSLDAEARRLHALTLIGQCVFFRHARPVLDVLYGPDAYAGPDAIPALTDHIVTVFLRGLGLGSA